MRTPVDRLPAAAANTSRPLHTSHTAGRCGTSLMLLGALLVGACAQVPRESVELSTTVGRDIAEVYRSHRELANLLYDRMEADVNRFVDDVYAPYQISKLLSADQADFQGGNEQSLFFKLNAAVRQPNNPGAQQSAVQFMDVFVQVVRQDVEAYRKERLAPVAAQRQELLSAIDRSYNQIHYANSIVTGHLASVVKVHDAQEEILNRFGLEGLNVEIGTKLANASNKVAEFVNRANAVEGTVAQAEALIADLTKGLDAAVAGVEVPATQGQNSN